MVVLVAALALVASLLLALAQEPAHASSTFTVTNTNDSGAGSLRQAILDANFTDGPSVINFNISGSGVKSIKPTSALPTITEQVSIDGYTQPGASPNTRAVGNDASLKIELDGSNAPQGTRGLEIVAFNSVIKGLVINRFSSTGIFVSGPTVGTRIEGNFIGTDPTGTIDRGNGGLGVDIEGDGVSQGVVGGTTPAARNLIFGNAGEGVFIGGSSSGARADSMRVQGNYVGTDRSGTKDLGNDEIGIDIEVASNTTVGGTTAASRNVVSGNFAGLDLVFDSNTKILGNRIGTTASGTGALGNDDSGVLVEAGSSNNQIGDGTAAGSNTIAFNGFDGVQVLGDSTGNRITRNSIFSNTELGIELFAPAQNAPVLSSAKTSSTRTTIKGTLASTPGKSFTIEFFSNPSGGEEGKKFIGKKSVSTDASGNASFTFVPATKVAVGQTVTATATRTPQRTKRQCSRTPGRWPLCRWGAPQGGVSQRSRPLLGPGPSHSPGPEREGKKRNCNRSYQERHRKGATEIMTNTQATTKTGHYFRAMLTMLAMLAAMLVAGGAALAATTAFSNS